MKAMRGVWLTDWKRFVGLVLMLPLGETIDHSTMANSVRWYGHVLRRKDHHILSRALVFVVEVRKRGRKGHLRNRLRKKA